MARAYRNTVLWIAGLHVKRGCNGGLCNIDDFLHSQNVNGTPVSISDYQNNPEAPSPSPCIMYFIHVDKTVCVQVTSV